MEYKQKTCCYGISFNDSKLGRLSFDLKETLNVYKDIKNNELKLLLDDYNSNDNLNSNFFSIISQIAQDEQQNKI